MTKINSVVQVNGYRYDGLTGQAIDRPKSHAKSSGKKMIDGFVIGNHHKATKSSPSPKNKAQGLHQKPQRTKTLMRQAVNKPQPAQHKPSASHPQQSKPGNVRQLNSSAPKHAKVNRFGFLPTAKDRPAEVVKINAQAKPRHKIASAEVAPRLPSMVASASHNKIEKLLDEALAKADAHKQMLNSHRKQRSAKNPRWVLVSVVSVIVAAIAAVLIWQNLPSVAVHVASARAHVKASIPGYTPSGYSMSGPVKYGNGAVTMKFKSENAQTFSLTQKSSNWDSTSLASNYLPANTPVQTSEISGTTVYIYGSASNAAWVNHGVLYSLRNDAHLPSDQVFKIVQSL